METKTYLTISEAAKVLKITTNGVRYFIHTGKLSSKRQGPLRTTVIPADAVLKLAVERSNKEATDGA